MLLRILVIALAAGAMLSPLSAQTESRVVLKSVSVNLPYGARAFPGGHEADAINRNCLVCHSPGMVVNQPALTKAQWQAEIDKMRTTYKAPVDPKDVDAILAYLISINSSIRRAMVATQQRTKLKKEPLIADREKPYA